MSHSSAAWSSGSAMGFGARDAEPRHVGAQPRQRALIEEAGEIVGAVRQQFAATDADEQFKKLALDPLRTGGGRRIGEREMREPERTGIAAQRREPVEKRGVGRTAKQDREQCVFLRAGRIHLVDRCGGFGRVKIGPQNRARYPGDCLHSQHAFGGNAAPVRNGRLGNTDLARKRPNAACGANRLVESRIAHLSVHFIVLIQLCADIGSRQSGGQ